MFKYILFFLVLGGAVYSLRAAPINTSSVEMALQMPIENRIRIIKTQGPDAIVELKEIAFNKKQSLQERWRAVTVISRVFPNEGREVIEMALNSKDWYLRDAATIGLKYSNREWAIAKAETMLADSALVVRTSAVNTLKDLGAIEAESLLWEKLYAAENFNKGQSLWVRKHIAETLAKFARSGQETSFMKMLKDDDRQLHEPAVIALNRIYGKKQTRDEWLQR